MSATPTTLETWLEHHLDTYIQHHINADHQVAFKAYALARLQEDYEHWLNIGWSTLYGQFLSSDSYPAQPRRTP